MLTCITIRDWWGFKANMAEAVVSAGECENAHLEMDILCLKSCRRKPREDTANKGHCSSNHEDNIFDIWSTFCQDRIEVLASILKGTMPTGAPADAPSYYLCFSAFISCWNSRNDHGDACDGPSFVCPLTSSLHGSIDVAVAGKAVMAITIRFLVAASLSPKKKKKILTGCQHTNWGKG